MTRAKLAYKNSATTRTCDVIEHEQKLWLVTGWLSHNALPVKRPQRIICLSSLQYQAVDLPDAAFLVTQPMPRGLFDLSIPPQLAGGYTVIDDPDIVLPDQGHDPS